MNSNSIRRGAMLLFGLILSVSLSACSAPNIMQSPASEASAASAGSVESNGTVQSSEASAPSSVSSSASPAASAPPASAAAEVKNQGGTVSAQQKTKAAQVHSSAPSSQSAASSEKSQKAASSAKPSKPASSASAGTVAPSLAAQVLQLVNQERAKNGQSALTMSAGASQAAQVRATEIVSSFSHTRPNGTSCFTALDQAKVSYSTAGENIAYGYPDAASVMNGWMNSPGHRANILNSSFRQLGVGVYRASNGTFYWVQEFIG